MPDTADVREYFTRASTSFDSLYADESTAFAKFIGFFDYVADALPVLQIKVFGVAEVREVPANKLNRVIVRSGPRRVLLGRIDHAFADVEANDALDAQFG